MSRKIWFALPLISLSLTFSACDKTKKIIESLLTFHINRSIPEQTVERSLAPCQINMILDLPIAGLQDVQFSKEQDFPEQNTEVRLIRSARVESISLNLTEQSTERTWDWLDSITIYIESGGQERQKIASLPEVPDGQSVLNLNMENVDIAGYIKAEGGFAMTTEVSGCPPQNTAKFGGSYRVKVSASPL